jgi:hypothetical protein
MGHGKDVLAARIDEKATEALGLPLCSWPELANKLGPAEAEKFIDQLLLLSARAERMALFIGAFTDKPKSEERMTTV